MCHSMKLSISLDHLLIKSTWIPSQNSLKTKRHPWLSLCYQARISSMWNSSSTWIGTIPQMFGQTLLTPLEKVILTSNMPISKQSWFYPNRHLSTFPYIIALTLWVLTSSMNALRESSQERVMIASQVITNLKSLKSS